MLKALIATLKKIWLNIKDKLSRLVRALEHRTCGKSLPFARIIFSRELNCVHNKSQSIQAEFEFAKHKKTKGVEERNEILPTPSKNGKVATPPSIASSVRHLREMQVIS